MSPQHIAPNKGGYFKIISYYSTKTYELIWAWSQENVTSEDWCLFCLFVWFDSLRPINNLSVIKGRVFLGWTSTKLGLMFLLKDTMQWRRWGLVSSQALYHWATALPVSGVGISKSRPQFKSVKSKINFLISQNICYGYSKELSHWQMFKLIEKKYSRTSMARTGHIPMKISSSQG